MKISHRIGALILFALCIVMGGPVMAAVGDLPDSYVSASLNDQTEPLTVGLAADADVTAAVLLRQERMCSDLGEGAGVITADKVTVNAIAMSPGGATGIIGGGSRGAEEYDGLSLIGGGSSGEALAAIGEGHRDKRHGDRRPGI